MLPRLIRDVFSTHGATFECDRTLCASGICCWSFAVASVWAGALVLLVNAPFVWCPLLSPISALLEMLNLTLDVLQCA